MKNKRLLLTLFILICAVQANCKEKDSSKIDQLHKQFQIELNAGKDSAVITLKEQTSALATEQFKTMLAREKENQLEILDEQFDIAHRHHSFNFQYIASIIIFIVVILIVIAGLVFSAIQFNFTLKQMKLKDKLLQVVADPQNTQQLPDQLKTDLEFSKDGIKVNSSVLGVIILVFSVAFFYLYLIYVYPIKYITPQDAARITGTAPETLPKDTLRQPKLKPDKNKTTLQNQ